MMIRPIRTGFTVACLAASLAGIGCNSSTPTTSTPTTGPVPATAHYPGDPASKGVQNTAPPKSR